MSKPQRIPAESFHPSVFIRDELRARRWSKAKLARLMGGDASINLLALDMYFMIGPTNRNCRLDELMATDIGRAFDVSAEYFLNLEKAWLEHTSFPPLSPGARDEQATER